MNSKPHKSQKVEELEAKIAELEKRIASLEARTPITIPLQTWPTPPSYGGGWTCPYCHMWVYPNTYHSCNPNSLPTVTYSNTSPPGMLD